MNAMRKWMGLNELNEDELYGKERIKVVEVHKVNNMI